MTRNILYKQHANTCAHLSMQPSLGAAAADSFSLRKTLGEQLAATWRTHSLELEKFSEQREWRVASLCAGLDVLHMVLAALWPDPCSVKNGEGCRA